MPIEQRDGAIVITGENSIRYAQLCATRGALWLETKGIKASRHYNAAVVVRQLLKVKIRDKVKLLEKFDAYIAAEYPNARSAQ